MSFIVEKAAFLKKRNNYYHEDFEKREGVWCGGARETREPQVTIGWLLLIENIFLNLPSFQDPNGNWSCKRRLRCSRYIHTTNYHTVRSIHHNFLDQLNWSSKLEPTLAESIVCPLTNYTNLTSNELRRPQNFIKLESKYLFFRITWKFDVKSIK